ncbi:hypothetical protein GQ53DRAFT_817870 [Thozetella sp. PMI_491]|nr:hypothetical protein GQ53DRAFT_817870 [Thozetella sp. PMI_491]
MFNATSPPDEPQLGGMDILPNWLRIVLSILSLLSFLPELLHIKTKKDSTGVSLYYVLWNLVSVTEQFALGFLSIVNDIDAPTFFAGFPRTLGDWLNLWQLTLVWLVFLLFFGVCLHYSPASATSKAGVVAIYISFLLGSVVPAFMDALGLLEDPNGREWALAVFSAVHIILVNPVVTGLGIYSLFLQKSNAAALSRDGLLGQAIVFTLVAMSWIWRVNFPAIPPNQVSWSVFVSWYQVAGFAAVDNGVFALVQLILFSLAGRHQQTEISDEVPPEEQPLLPH